ncbi:MAG: lanthionine synthetase LanC family protein [Bacteroidales bacterium]|nr:lanthionine synthetase LanC family protein [Bacteroidales bacterium]
MKNEKYIRKLVDNILLNAYSVTSSGLYNGKTGMALALFEAARYFDDEYIESQAYGLIEEALLSKTNDISFESGLSGIGYVLLYLIDNEFIDADFDELFEDNHKKILGCINNEIIDSDSIMNSFNLNYYFIGRRLMHHEQDEIIEHIYSSREKYLIDNLKKFKDANSNVCKEVVLYKLKEYLKMLSLFGNRYSTNPVLKIYKEIYALGLIRSSFVLGCYLNKIIDDVTFQNIIEDNRKELLTVKYSNGTIKMRIEYDKITNSKTITNDLSLLNDKEFERYILDFIPKGSFIPGFENGLSALVLYLTESRIKL